MDAAAEVTGLRRDIVETTRTTWPALAVVALAGVAFILAMPAGLPYDEPAHWLNVQWWMDHWSMPVIGDPGTSYEAQMGPVAYVLYAVVAWPVRALLGDEAAFYAARGLGVLQLLAMCVMLAVAARRALRPARGIGVLVVLVAGLNPMLLAVSTSVQNDTLSIVLGGAALLVALSPSTGRLGNTALAGVLLGLAILTKVTVWPFAIGIAVALLVRRRLVALAVVAGTSLVVSGWWFVRNLALYGDVTGRAAVEEAGYTFPPLDLDPVGMVRHVITYLWLPTEYVRNVIQSPAAVDGIVLLLTLAAAVGCVMFARHRVRGSATVLAITVTAVVAFTSWVLLVETTQAIAFRTAYPVLLALYAGIGALVYLGARRMLIALLVPLVIVNAWFLVSLVQLSGLPEFIEF